MFKTKRVTLFDRFPASRFGTDTQFPVRLADLRKARYWSFIIYNRLDQDLTVELLGSSDESLGNTGNVGISITASAGSTEPVATNVWLPFEGLSLEAAVAPASGDVTVIAFIQEEGP